MTALILFISISVYWPMGAVAAGAQSVSLPYISAQSAILVEAETGAVLFEKNADNRMLIASTTKILTALVVLENCSLSEKVVIKDDFPNVEGSSMYLKLGEELTVLELLYGLLLASGNDAAVALALHVADSVDAFAALMNAYAKELGCENSHFVNPNGLDAADQYSSARDLSLITAKVMKNKTFNDIVSTKNITIAGRYMHNHNKLLWTCPGTIGVKTGYTKKAGRSLVSCVERDGMRLICVTISAPDDWNDHSCLIDWAYSQFGYFRINRLNDRLIEIPVISGTNDTVAVSPKEDYTLICAKKENIEILWEASKFYYAPITKGTEAGAITIKINGEVTKTISLIFDDDVALDESVPLNSWENIKRNLLGLEIQQIDPN